MKSLENAREKWLAARPEQCAGCGTVKPADDMSVDLRTGKHTCDACLKSVKK